MHLKLGVAVATGVEAKTLELVVARGELQRVHQDMAPDVPGRVFCTIDSDERALSIVCMHSEMVGATKEVNLERNSNVKPDVGVRSRSYTIGANAHILVGEERG
jgi:hypothetical protein